jgi:hypothetical protein
MVRVCKFWYEVTVIFVQDGITESVAIWDTFNIITMLVRVYSGTSLLWYEFTAVRVYTYSFELNVFSKLQYK